MDKRVEISFSILGIDPIIYTVSFSDGMNPSTANIDDFETGGKLFARLNAVVTVP